MRFSAGICFTALPHRSLLRHRQDGQTSDNHKSTARLKHYYRFGTDQQQILIIKSF